MEYLKNEQSCAYFSLADTLVIRSDGMRDAFVDEKNTCAIGIDEKLKIIFVDFVVGGEFKYELHKSDTMIIFCGPIVKKRIIEKIGIENEKCIRVSPHFGNRMAFILNEHEENIFHDVTDFTPEYYEILFSNIPERLKK